VNRDFLDRNRSNLLIASTIFFSYILLHLIFQRHELMAYDMYTYSSFVEHYSQNWFYTIIPGQAHGLEIVSYPPLLFQTMALLSFIPLLSQTSLYIVSMSAGVTALSFSFYILVRNLLNLEEDKYKLIIPLVAFSPGLLKFSLVHGQLPLIIGMVFGFLSASFFYRTVQGKKNRAHLTASLIMTAYIHHFSFLITGLMIITISLLYLRDTVSRIEYLIPPIAFSGIIITVGLYPMILESIFGISQGVIFHGSREPLRNISIFNQYISTTFGLSLIGILLGIKRKKQFRSVNILALAFLTIGLGLATPTAEILFGDMATFLVYDRYSLVSSLFLTSIIGVYIKDLDFKTRVDSGKILALLFIISSLAIVFWANNLHLGSYTGYGDFSEDQTETAIDYLNNNASSEYLYTTVGHKPPVGEIRRQTDIPTLDTGYFQGRKHGILKSHGKFDRLRREPFEQVIVNADNVSLKYVLTFNEWSNSWFRATEWEKTNLEDGVNVWINPDAPKYQADLGQKRALFGTLPFAAMIFSALVFFSASVRKEIEKYFAKTEDLIKDIVNHRKLEDRSRIWIFLIPLVAAAPSLLTTGYPSGIDTPAHIFKPELMAHMVEQHGQIFRWTDQWYNGYPFMSMYPPLSTNLIYYLYRISDNITLSYNLVRLLSITALSSVLYLLSENITEDRRIRVAVSAFGVLSYPLYSNLYTVGRLASALALPLYLFLIHLLLRDDIFQEKVSRGHLLIGVSAGILFLLHSMTAYLFIYTGLIFCWIYRDKVVNTGLKPILVTFAIPLLVAAPYLTRLVQHFSVSNSYWYVEPRAFTISGHLKRGFGILPPTFSGWIQTAFFVLSLVKIGKLKDKFFTFCLANFIFFYTAFWARNFRVAYFLPLSRQFDLARFEILFVVFGLLLAGYGLKYFLDSFLTISMEKKNLIASIIVVLVFVQALPMYGQAANWQHDFQEEITSTEFEEEYRAIGLDIRQWHAYLLWEMDVKNTFGWFNQANPNPRFTQSLQRAGGRWHGWSFVQDISSEDFRKNLMEISNTRYVISAKGEWLNQNKIYQVKGDEFLNHPLNQKLVDQLKEDPEFSQKVATQNLEVYELERNMSYCEGVKPVWITEDYNRKSRELFRKDRMLPELPIEGTESRREDRIATGVSCNKENPYSISVSVEDEGWVLVKESYYPFWERKNKAEIHDGFGFMTIYVEDKAELRYTPRDISTLELEDFRALFN
jgi:uncharacterized membrane protein